MTEKLLDFVEKRKENIEEKRRSFERVMFTNFLGCYTVLDQEGTHYPVRLVDFSREGCLFQIPWNIKGDKKFEEGKEITLRIYFTKTQYIPVIVQVKYGQEYIEKDRQTYMRYGCEFDTSMPSFEALQAFIEFMYKFAEHSTTDRGDSRVFFL
ncbi:MAG: PilZ domain-containing protein [Halobacteriovoraceae bacterium]|jgi:hypothetical protein|nr:PilZ domain-containing protein [Halobacteriovoraceae bacterium]MBT5095560.1 PilZ domain-containing protein [Halobacteriovoraceae bacterium]